MSERSTDAYQTKLVQVFFGLAFFLVCLFGVRSAMSGSVKTLGAIIGVIVLGGVVFALDQRFWLLLPVLSIVGVPFPGLRLDGTELGCLILTGVHWGRISFHRDRSLKINCDVLVAFPLFFWILFVFALNPVGMVIFGSETIGGRFYFKIAIAFFAFLSLATLRLSERDAKLLFRVLFVSSLFKAGLSIESSFQSMAPIGETSPLGEEIGARYYLIPLGELYSLLFARWAIADFLHAPIRLVFLVLTAIAAIFSGKRQLFGELAVIPIMRAYLTKKGIAVTLVCGVFAMFILGFMIVGDGSLFSLPQSAKRGLAVVAPKYARTAADGGMADLFRHELRKEAYEILRQNPWFGRKGFAMSLEETRWMNFGGGATSIYAGHAQAGNWHNMWLAYACDFGIPGLCFAIVIWLFVLRYAVRACRTVLRGTYLPSCCLYYSFSLFVAVCFGWVAGHSSLSTQSMFVQYGFLIAIVNGYRESYSDRFYSLQAPNCSKVTVLEGNAAP